MLRLRMVIALVLIATGIAGFAYQGIKYMTAKQASAVESTGAAAKEPHRMPLPPVIGLVTLIVGIVLLLMDDGGVHHGRSSFNPHT